VPHPKRFNLAKLTGGKMWFDDQILREEEAGASARRASEAPDRLHLAFIDSRPLTRLSLFHVLERDSPANRRAEDFVVLPFSSSAELVTAYGELYEDLKLLLLNIGAVCPREDRVLKDIEFLREKLSHIPLILLSDADDRCHVLEAFRRGVRGFISTTLSPKVMIQVLRLVAAGGTFIPSEIFFQDAESDANNERSHRCAPRADGVCLAAGWPERLQPPGQLKANRLRELSGEKYPNRVPPESQMGLTPRQLEVLRRLRQGKSNKCIAYELEMQETTVKAHVREILRRLRVTNRTHAALLASEIL
jgi:DNA-binding NarL/FixJ family response regulator